MQPGHDPILTSIDATWPEVKGGPNPVIQCDFYVKTEPASVRFALLEETHGLSVTARYTGMSAKPSRQLVNVSPTIQVESGLSSRDTGVWRLQSSVPFTVAEARFELEETHGLSVTARYAGMKSKPSRQLVNVSPTIQVESGLSSRDTGVWRLQSSVPFTVAEARFELCVGEDGSERCIGSAYLPVTAKYECLVSTGPATGDRREMTEDSPKPRGKLRRERTVRE